MSQEAEIRAVIDRYADAWQANDIGKLVDCYHDDIELHWPGKHALSGTHKGKPAALAALIAFAGKTDRKLLGIPACMYGQTHGCLISHEALGKGTARIEIERVLGSGLIDQSQ